MRKLLFLVLPMLLLLGVSFTGPGISLFGRLDYGIPWVVRGMETGTVCSTPPVWGISQQTIADKAVFIDLDAENAVSTVLAEKGSALSPSTDANGAVMDEDPDCWPSGTGTTGGYNTIEGIRNWVAEVNALRRSGGAPLQAMLWYRLDTVSYPMLALPGFTKEFLVDTIRTWSDVTAFFSTESDYVCQAMTGGGGCDTTCDDSCGGVACSDAANVAAGRCGYNFCYSGDHVEYAHTSTTQDCQRPDKYLDALTGATATTYQTKVHYLPHQSGIVTGSEYLKRFTFASGYLANLSNASYQAWQIARMAALWGQVSSWAHSFHLTWKAAQYMCREAYDLDGAHSKLYHTVEQWIGGDGDKKCNGWDTDHYDGAATNTSSHATHDAYRIGGGTPWSAQPTSYGWSEYVVGFKAVTDGLIAAGVPYSLNMDQKAWWRSDSNWNNDACSGAARCACDYSAATGTQRSDGWQLGDGSDNCDYYDDPGTLGVNENTVLLGIIRGAKLVLVGTSANTYDVQTIDDMTDDLVAHGVQVIQGPAGVSNYTDYIARPIP